MLSTLPSDFKNLTAVLSPLTDNNNKKNLPYELDNLQKDKKVSRTINIYTSLIFQIYLISERLESL